ncbi:MAG TPA: hypothetical protein VJB14_00790, partial [Planctomycetota bacterium]|nr:hypothetical protein [Planctomycetota bacterium]
MEGPAEFRGVLLALFLALQAPSPEELAKKIEESVRADGAWLDKTFDLDALFARSLKDAPGDPKRKEGFARGVRKSFNLGRKTAQAAQGGSYRLLRIRTVDGKPRPLFRMISEGGLNYQEFLLEDSRIVDVYPYIQGEWMSETLRRLCTVALASDPAGGGLKDNEYMKNLPAIQKMTALQNGGKSAEALAVYAALPASLRKEKSLLLARYQMASE